MRYAHNAAPARCGCDPTDPKTQPYARPTTLNRQFAGTVFASMVGLPLALLHAGSLSPNALGVR